MTTFLLCLSAPMQSGSVLYVYAIIPVPAIWEWILLFLGRRFALMQGSMDPVWR